MKNRNTLKRAGFTLIEILVALAILVLAVVSQIMATGLQAAINSDLTPQAILQCETVMAEILAGCMTNKPVVIIHLRTDRITGTGH